MSLVDLMMAILVLSWIGGIAARPASGVVHLLLVLPAIALIFRMRNRQRILLRSRGPYSLRKWSGHLPEDWNNGRSMMIRPSARFPRHR
ncbi:MAG: lmo0937 family membrane protein [Elusimicrobia bacterium]|nr:lmo0937 family membrane protein [Elusimicrobiota bacterium]